MDLVGKGGNLQNHRFEPGDLVVYTMSKQSPHPGPRARSVHPSELGEDYSYVVDKFWMVVRILNPQQLQLVTRKGKIRTAEISDPLLRKANWWQKFRYRARFPKPDLLESLTEEGNHASTATDSVSVG